MQRHGLALPENAIVTATAYERAAGEVAAMDLLAVQPTLTAIVAANDLLALGLLQALRARGLSCPADMSVVGHNDMPLVDMIDPPLTTVRIGPREMGHDAARLLLSELEGGARTTVRRVILKPELILRASTAAQTKSR